MYTHSTPLSSDISGQEVCMRISTTHSSHMYNSLQVNWVLKSTRMLQPWPDALTTSWTRGTRNMTLCPRCWRTTDSTKVRGCKQCLFIQFHRSFSRLCRLSLRIHVGCSTKTPFVYSLPPTCIYVQVDWSLSLTVFARKLCLPRGSCRLWRGTQSLCTSCTMTLRTGLLTTRYVTVKEGDSK